MIALIAIAGGFGAITRFMLDGVIRSKVGTTLPLATMIINVTGSLILGFITGIVLFHAAPDGWQLVLGTGFLGGYTTFSTASVETVRLIQERHLVMALVNGLWMLVLAVMAAAIGIGLAWLV